VINGLSILDNNGRCPGTGASFGQSGDRYVPLENVVDCVKRPQGTVMVLGSFVAAAVLCGV